MIWFPFEQNTINLQAIGHIHYVQLNKQTNIVDNSVNYQQLIKHCQNLEKENQQLKNQIIGLKNKLKAKKILKTRKIKRRPECQLIKNFQCLYPKCKKQYASQLALNLHMKMKHNAGSKRQRQKLMNQIIKAQAQGVQLPTTNIILPPKYIEKFRSQKRTLSIDKNRNKNTSSNQYQNQNQMLIQNQNQNQCQYQQQQHQQSQQQQSSQSQIKKNSLQKSKN